MIKPVAAIPTPNDDDAENYPGTRVRVDNEAATVDPSQQP